MCHILELLKPRAAHELIAALVGQTLMLGIHTSRATPSLKLISIVGTMQVTVPMRVVESTSAAVEVTMGCRFSLLTRRQMKSPWFEKCMVACVTERRHVCDSVDLALHPAALLST